MHIHNNDLYSASDTLSDLEPSDILEPVKTKESDHYPHPLYQLKLEYSNESLYATHPNLTLQKGDYVITPTRYGNDIALVMGNVNNPIDTTVSDIVTINRKADKNDFNHLKEMQKKEIAATKLFKEKVTAHQLDMKLIQCHYLFEESKALFFFSADSRIDFRKLVKDLVAILRIRIELRQIGVRDEAKFTGGLGGCGRAVCCHSVTDRQQPVSIKMAKEQNLSLNSVKISGQCGRLMCCLGYEHSWYTEAKKKLPNTGTIISYDKTTFRITDINCISGIATLSGEDGRVLSIPSTQFYNRNGRWQIKD